VSDKDFVVKNGLVVGTTATIAGITIDPSGATENQILKFDGTKFAPATNTGGGVGSTYAGTIGNGTDTEYTVTHNLGTRDVLVVARNAESPYEQIDVRWEATSVNTVKFDFSSPPSNNSVRVAVYAAVAGNTLATTTVSTSAPENSSEGDLWFDSNSAGMFVYYDSQWVEIGWSSASSVNPVLEKVDAKGDLLVGDAADSLARLAVGSNGQILTANSSTATGLQWTTLTVQSPVITLAGDLSGSATLTNLGNATLTATIAANSVTLGTDTTGNYVQSLVAGTGISLSNNSGEGSTPTIAVDTSAIQARVANVSDTEISYLDGVTSSIQTQIDTKASTGKAIAMAIVFGG
jgi:hypothetical protein